MFDLFFFSNLHRVKSMHADTNIFLHYHLNTSISRAKGSTMYFNSKKAKAYSSNFLLCKSVKAH